MPKGEGWNRTLNRAPWDNGRRDLTSATLTHHERRLNHRKDTKFKISVQKPSVCRRKSETTIATRSDMAIVDRFSADETIGGAWYLLNSVFEECRKRLEYHIPQGATKLSANPPGNQSPSKNFALFALQIEDKHSHNRHT